MPLFRRRSTAPAVWFTVGDRGHRVAVDASPGGIEQLAGLGDYVEGISRRRPPREDGRESTAVLNAKMDHADTVNDLVAASVDACVELIERGVLEPSMMPPPPPEPGFTRGLSTYEYIQEMHAHALERREWLDNVDALFRLNGVLLLAPLPPED